MSSKDLLEKARQKKLAQAQSGAPVTKMAASVISGAIVSSASEAPEAKALNAKLIPLDLIYTEEQVRDVDENRVEEYAASIRGTPTKQPLQPITVWENSEGRYLLIMGEHRFRAQLLNNELFNGEYDTISAIVLDGACPEGSHRRRMQVLENLHHSPMNDIDLALVIKKEMEIGNVKNISDAVRWLRTSDDKPLKSEGSVRVVLTQVFALLDDSDCNDLIELVRSGQMKAYKADQIRRERAAEKINAQRSNVAIDEPDLISDSEVEDSLSEIKIKSDPKPKGKKSADAPLRFSIDFDDAQKLLFILNKQAEELGLPSISYSDEIKRKQWDSIIKDRLSEIYEEANQ